MGVKAMFTCAEVQSYGGGWSGPKSLAEKAGLEITQEFDHTSSYAAFPDEPVVSTRGKGQEQVKLTAVMGDGENAEWATATPSGELTMSLNNPAAWGFFEPGEDYVIEIRKRMPQRARNFKLNIKENKVEEIL